MVTHVTTATPDFELLFQCAPGNHLVLTPDLMIVGANDAYLRTTLTNRADLVGRSLFDAFPELPADPHEESGARLRTSLARTLEQRRPDCVRIRRYARRAGAADGSDDEERWILANNTPVFASDAPVQYIIHSVEDVAERMASQENEQQQTLALRQQLIHSEQRSAQLLDTAPDAVVVVGPDAKIELVNAQAELLFGYRRAELLGEPLECLIPEHQRERHAARVEGFFRDPCTRPMGTGLELSARKKDGTEFPVEVSLSPLQGDHGRTVSAAIRDISRRRQTEAEAKLNAERFASAVESMQHAFAMYDGSDRLVRCNAAYRELLADSGIKPLAGELRERFVDAWLDLATPEPQVTRGELRTRWLNLTHDKTYALDLRTHDKRSLRVAGRRTDQGDIVELIWDLTDEERRNDELRRARIAAEAASAAKSEFLSSMSHELRTPLNAILGFAQLLMRDTKQPMPERHRERVGQILRGGEQLLRLIDDVLDVARIESGRISISSEPVSIVDVLADVTTTLAPVAERHEVQLRAEPVSARFPPVVADRVRLVQILVNYVSNAIKYNRPHGNVLLCTEAHDHVVRLMVRDSGVGIPIEQQSNVFQPFQRAGQEAGPIEGTGVGLFITKRLAELMGGTVGFESTPGQGSTFWVELPLTAASSQGQAARLGHAAAAERLGPEPHGLVLYVEDNPANIAFMTDLFESFDGLRLVTARSAEEGVRLARALLPEVVVMDINLPDMSGLQALAALRSSGETRHIPVIALTAAASQRDKKRGSQAGFFRYLTKPINIDELATSLQAALTR